MLTFNHIEEYLERKNWIKRVCTSCNKIFLVKRNMLLAKCGSQKSGCSNFDFLSLGRKNRLYKPAEIVKLGAEYFLQKHYSVRKALPIVSRYGNNLFIGTAGQHFDEYIHTGQNHIEDAFFTAQPVVRLQSRHIVGQIQGFSTSFVNISTEHLNASLDEHLNHLEDWFSFVSELGMYTGNLTLQVKKDKPTWGLGEFSGVAIAIYYRGVEIGYANYFTDVPTQSGKKVTISDVSFGLERMLWATNKTPSYLQGIGPLNIAFKPIRHKYMDAIRTAVLMSASGVHPGHKDRGCKLRDLFKDFTKIDKEFPENLVRHYFRWWSNFLLFQYSERELMYRIRNEWSRNFNSILQKKLHAPNSISVDMEPEDYIRLLVKHSIPLEEIISLMEDSSQHIKVK